MQNVTIRLQEELIDRLDGEADEEDASRSEYVRQILQDRHERESLEDEIDSLQERLESRQKRIEQLESQLARRSNIEEKIEDLPDKVREVESEPEPPFFVSWVRWWRNRGE